MRNEPTRIAERIASECVECVTVGGENAYEFDLLAAGRILTEELAARDTKIAALEEELSDMANERDCLLEWVVKFPAHSPETLWNLLQTETAKIAVLEDANERLRGALVGCSDKRKDGSRCFCHSLNSEDFDPKAHRHYCLNAREALSIQPSSLEKLAEAKQKVVDAAISLCGDLCLRQTELAAILVDSVRVLHSVKKEAK